MRIHERTLRVQGAGAEMAMAIAKVAEKNQLTCVEVVTILLGEAQGYQRHILKRERHPNDPGKGADEA